MLHRTTDPAAAPTAPGGGRVLGAHHPAVLRELSTRAGDVQLRVADQITRLAGSMAFVYLHVVGFALWMVMVEGTPWPTLTLVVSLEAIFLSTFVMIGQNRQAEFQRAKADHDFVAQEQELHLNTELTRRIDELVREIHGVVVAVPTAPRGANPAPPAALR